jgi:putative membrane protein
VLEQQALEAPRLGQAAKLPALAPPPAAADPALPAPAERHRTAASDGTGRGAPASDGDVAPPEPQPEPPAPPVNPPAPPADPPAPPADPPAPPADPPAPPAQPRHPPPTQEPGVLTFDDSG